MFVLGGGKEQPKGGWEARRGTAARAFAGTLPTIKSRCIKGGGEEKKKKPLPPTLLFPSDLEKPDPFPAPTSVDVFRGEARG